MFREDPSSFPRQAEALLQSPIEKISGLEPLSNGEYARTTVIETAVTVRNRTYPCQIALERADDRQSNLIHGGNFQQVRLAVEIFSEQNPEERLALYRGVLNYGQERYRFVATDGKNHRYWRIFTRMVEGSARRHGLGTASLEIFEAIATQISQEYPELQGEWIEIVTSLSSLTRLVISQEWLLEQGLERYTKTGPDFGYVPHPDDEYATRRVLAAGATGLEEIGDRNIPEICLYKRMAIH